MNELQQILTGAMQTALMRQIAAAGGMIQVKLGEIDTDTGFDFKVVGDTAYFLAKPPKPPSSIVPARDIPKLVR